MGKTEPIVIELEKKKIKNTHVPSTYISIQCTLQNYGRTSRIIRVVPFTP